MSVESAQQKLKKDLDASMEALAREFAKIQTGRASPGLLDDVTVEAYGQSMPLSQVASVTAPEARVLRIDPYDAGNLGAIEKGIQKSNLGLTPNNDGKVIHINIPALTEERRRDYVKMAKAAGEECKISQRNARHAALDAIKQLEKDKEISQDDQKKASERVQQMIDDYGKKVDAGLKTKEEEILKV